MIAHFTIVQVIILLIIVCVNSESTAKKQNNPNLNAFNNQNQNAIQQQNFNPSTGISQQQTQQQQQQQQQLQSQSQTMVQQQLTQQQMAQQQMTQPQQGQAQQSSSLGQTQSSKPQKVQKPSPYVTSLSINCLESCPKNQYGSCILPYQKAPSRYFYRCVNGEPLFASCFLGMVYSPHHNKCLPMFQLLPAKVNTINQALDSLKLPAPPSLPSTAAMPMNQAVAPALTPPAPALPLPMFSDSMAPTGTAPISGSDPISDSVALVGEKLEIMKQMSILVELITLALKKFDQIENNLVSADRKIEKKMVMILQAIKESALICKTRFNMDNTCNNDDKHGSKDDNDNEEEFQTMLDQKLFEQFNEEDTDPAKLTDKLDPDNENDSKEMDQFQKLVDSLKPEYNDQLGPETADTDETSAHDNNNNKAENFNLENNGADDLSVDDLDQLMNIKDDDISKEATSQLSVGGQNKEEKPKKLDEQLKKDLEESMEENAQSIKKPSMSPSKKPRPNIGKQHRPAKMKTNVNKKKKQTMVIKRINEKVNDDDYSNEPDDNDEQHEM